MNQEIIQPVLELTKKYKIDALKFKIFYHLNEHISIDNAFFTLRLSELYKCPELKDMTLDFIVKNLKDIGRTEDYKSFPVEFFYLFKEITDKIIATLK